MYKSLLLKSLPIAGFALLLTACVDDNYDLSDVDTTTEVKVNGLVLPVNFGDLTLNTVIDLDDDDDPNSNKTLVKETLPDGSAQYVFRTSGSFSSDPIKIESFTVKAPTDLQSTTVTVNLHEMMPYSQVRREPSMPTLDPIVYDITSMHTDFSYKINDVDSKVQEVTEIQTPNVEFIIELSVPASFDNDAESIELRNTQIAFPKGLTMKNGKPAEASIGTYNPTTGMVSIKEATAENGKLMLTLTAQNLNLKDMGVILKNGHFDYSGRIEVKEGDIIITPKQGKIFPPSFDFTASYTLSSFDIENFSGKVDYDIEDLAFDPVNIDDLPDFLDKEGTAINIANPQIYLSITNTCAPYGLGGNAGFTITPVHDGTDRPTLSLNEPLVLGTNDGVGPYKYAISPAGENLVPTVAGYANAEKLLFSKLGEVLYGNGIPQQLKVDFVNPQLTGTAKKFPLHLPGKPASQGRIDPVSGEYEFRAPLALASGSKIIYSGTEDDWDSEDLEDLHVTELVLMADVTSTIPMEVNLNAHLLAPEVNGVRKKMGVCTATPLAALADNQAVEITITPAEGEEYISDIDGIWYEVSAIAPEDFNSPTDTPALSPDMTLILKNVRAKVTGSYVREL